MTSDPARKPSVGLFPIWIAIALIVIVVAGLIRWGLIQTIVVVAFAGMLLAGALINRPRDITGAAGASWVALTLVSFSPVAFGLLIFAITPTYFRPLYEDAQGVTMLVGFAVVVAVGSAASQLAVRSFRHGHNLAGAVLSSLTVICVLPALFFVLLGPSIAVLVRPGS